MTSFTTSHIDTIPSGVLVQSAWDGFRRRLTSAKDKISDAQTKWSGLDSQLKLPSEMNGLYRAFDPPQSIMDDADSNASTVSGGITIFTEALEVINQRTRQVHTDITAFHRTYPDGVELDEAQIKEKQREERRIDAEITSIAMAYAHAANTLKNNVQSVQLDSPHAVPLHFPGGGDATERNQASALAEALRTGTSSDPQTDFATLRSLLAGLSPQELERWAREYPQLNLVVPPQGARPQENRAWWDGLTAEQKSALTTHVPGIVGNLEGLTYADRRPANARNLEIMTKRVEDQQSGRKDWGLSHEQIRAYQNLDATVKNGVNHYGTGPGGVGMLSFDPVGVDGQPLAAVVIGDLDAATHQSWYIPGMGSFLKDNVGGVFGDAKTLHEGQQTHLNAGESNAMVMWMGYRPPSAPYKGESLLSSEVMRSGHARDGGERLRYALNGMNYMNEQRDGAKPYTSVTAHSYGTTTSAYALSTIDHKVNSVVFFGSAGLDNAAARTAHDFNVETDPNTGRPAVYSGTAKADNVARIPIHLGSQEGWGPPRYSPTDDDFGGNVFQVDGEGNLKPVSGHEAQKAADDQGYLDPGTQSHEAIAALSVGRGDHIKLWDEAYRDDEWFDGSPEVIHQP